MGVHQRQRELDELKDHYIKKSSCILFVVAALLVGAFLGNAVTMMYVGQRDARMNAGAPAPAPQAQQQAPTANPTTLANLESAANANPTDFGAWVKLGNYCFDNGLPQKAISAYERALELSPMNENVWSDLGVMYRRTKQYDKAIDAFEHAASLDKQHITSRFNMGIVYLHDLNDPKAAIRAWKEVLAINPDAKTTTGQPLVELVTQLEQQ